MKTAPQVTELRELLGHDVLLLPWPQGTKGERRAWKHLTAATMDDPAHLRKLSLGNIGVALGQVSGGLCSLDIDSDEEMAHFLELNPVIGKTLQSRGSRGGNLWWRVTDASYPRLKVLKRHGKGWGEWRSTGSQTIIHGQHPDGHNYQIVNRVKPVAIKMIQIQWPEGIYPLLKGGSMAAKMPKPDSTLPGNNRTDVTDETDASDVTDESHVTHETEATKEVLLESVVLVANDFPEVLILKAIPNAAHTSHILIFELAREVRTFEANNDGHFGPAGLRTIFDRWYGRAKPFLRSELTDDEYFMEFMNAYRKVKCLIGEDKFGAILGRARKVAPPEEVVALFKHPSIRLLASLCRELQILWEDQPFYLSCRTVEKEFNVSVSTASTWLSGLEACGFIRTVVKGDNKTMRASRFRYLLPHQKP